VSHRREVLRPALYMAAVAVTRTESPLSKFYRHLIDQGTTESRHWALMRKLLLIMRSVLIHDRMYEPHPVQRNLKDKSASVPARPEGGE